MKTILVPTDFSEYSENALSLAIQLARKVGAAIHLLHVVEAPTTQSFNTMGMVGPDTMEQKFHVDLIAQVKAKMDEIASRKSLENIDLQIKVKVGKPYDSISEHVTEQKADLVVIGTKGIGELEEILIGSITEKVVRFATCPVISIPASVDLEAINKIVFATDLTNKSHQLIDLIKYFQKVLNASIELLWVLTSEIIDNENTMLLKVEEYAKENSFENCNMHLRKSISVEGGIMYFAQEIDADLIVMATHGRQGLAHIFSGSLAEDIVNHSKRPVLTLSLKE